MTDWMYSISKRNGKECTAKHITDIAITTPTATSMAKVKGPKKC